MPSRYGHLRFHSPTRRVEYVHVDIVWSRLERYAMCLSMHGHGVPCMHGMRPHHSKLGLARPRQDETAGTVRTNTVVLGRTKQPQLCSILTPSPSSTPPPTPALRQYRRMQASLSLCPSLLQRPVLDSKSAEVAHQGRRGGCGALPLPRNQHTHHWLGAYRSCSEQPAMIPV